MAAGRIDYALHDRFLVLKFIGQIRYGMDDGLSGPASLNAFLRDCFEGQKLDDVIIDLTEAESIDSTNLGLMAKVTRYTQQHLSRKAVIISTNHDINILLESVGFEEVFVILTESDVSGEGLKPLPAHESARAELAKLVLEAHKELAALNEQNARAFKSVISALEMDRGEE